MAPQTLGDYYNKWDRICSSWSDDEVEEPPRKKPPPQDKPMIDPKDISVSFGTPMTEEEFKSRHKNIQRSSSSMIGPADQT